ncbi:MAG: zinc dependent phospholipase C family protein [Cellulosilyticaceae bacterium]
MRVRTHMLVVDKAYDMIQSYLPIEFNPIIIRFGAMAPDVMPNRRFKSHNPNRAAREWTKFLAFVEKRKYTTWLLSYAAGVMSHYISDTFCYAHNFYNIELTKHLEYEVQMQRTLEEYQALEVSLGDVFKNWELLQNKGVSRYVALKNEAYCKEAALIQDPAERMIYDMKNSIIQSAVWMLEIAYVLSPGLVNEGLSQFA